MEWLNLHRPTLDSEAFLDAEPREVWVWLRLMAYCADQENGGRIQGALAWSEQKWLRLTWLNQADTQTENGLWEWEGEDLVVSFYPGEQEQKVRVNRMNGSKGGRPQNPDNQPVNPSENHVDNQPVNPSENHVVKRKGKEGKGKEGKSKGSARAEESESGFAEIPTEEEVRAWAIGAAGMDPAYAARQWRKTGETHGWVKNGRLIRWRDRFLGFWNEDREGWLERQKKNAAANGHRREGDEAWWWSEDAETVSRALTGALLAEDRATVARLQEILEVRKAM